MTAVELVSRAGIVVVSHPAEPSRVVPAAARPPTAVPAASRVPTMSTAGAARAARGLWPAGEFRSHVSPGSAEFRSHDFGPVAVRQRPPSRRLRPRPRPSAASPRPPCGRWQSSTGAGAQWRPARTTRCSAGKPSSASSCRGPYAARLVARRVPVPDGRRRHFVQAPPSAADSRGEHRADTRGTPTALGRGTAGVSKRITCSARGSIPSRPTCCRRHVTDPDSELVRTDISSRGAGARRGRPDPRPGPTIRPVPGLPRRHLPRLL